MSSIATFHPLETAKLPALQENTDIKTANSREVIDFQYSGHAFATLLPFLEEKEINLWESDYNEIADALSQKHENTSLILTCKHRKQYLDALAPELFTPEALLAFNQKFAEEDDPALVEAEIAGIKALRDSLALLQDDNHVVLLTIG
jgi:hypothetical protein